MDKDSLGEVRVPADRLWGAQTQRSIENFPIGRERFVGDPPEEGPGVVDILWMISFAAFTIGVVLFAIGTIKGRVLPLASAVLMLVGLVAAIAIDMATGAFFEDEPTTTEWGFHIGVPLFGLGLVWAGYTVWKGLGSREELSGPAQR